MTETKGAASAVPAFIPGTHQAALVGVQYPAFVAGRKYAEQQLRAERLGAHPVILKFAPAFIKECAKYGVPMFAHEYVRSAERQMKLRALGNSKARAGQSPHQYGMAVDIVHGVHGWNLDRKQWAVLGLIGKEVARRQDVKLTWGGDWKFYDPAHWEIADWKQLALKR
ncbi:hypothetical protein [Tortoise microvirus 46]|nr:hypothetical protein [Tortoise microvirus 46]